METLREKIESSPQPPTTLRRSKSVRASLRIRWRSTRDEEKRTLDEEPFELPADRRMSIAAPQSWSEEKLSGFPDLGTKGTFAAKSPTMPKRKHDRKLKRNGDVDLILKPQSKAEKSNKFSDLFTGRNKYKSSQTYPHLPVSKIPPKAAAILQIPRNEEMEVPVKNKEKGKFKMLNLKNVGKSESLSTMKKDVEGRQAGGRVRRGSEGEIGAPSSRGGEVNAAFVYSTPPKDRTYLKLQYGALLEGCGGELPSLNCAPPRTPLSPPGPHPHRAMTKKSDSLPINLHANDAQTLFAAMENGHLEKAKNIITSTDVDVNSLNPDGLSALDVAVLFNLRQLARLLMEQGAKEGNQLKSPEALGAQLRTLARDAEARLHEAGGAGDVRAAADTADAARSAAGGAGTTGCAGGAAAERDKQAMQWERRHRTLKRLLLGWQQLRAPGAPPPPQLEVCSATQVAVRLRDSGEGALVTKYRVEWSLRADFSAVCGSRETGAGAGAGAGAGGARLEAGGLARGQRYYFRAQAGNLKGWGPSAPAAPCCVVPSSWRDVETRRCWDARAAAALLETLGAEAADARPSRLAAPPPRAARKKTTIRQLFTAASKFQKNLRRGAYLACILYHDDKVLVTNEDFLPAIEVDDTYPTCFYTDFHWLMKVSCAWDDVKALRADMERHTSSSLHFRLKLLAAAAHMQSALCTQHIGQVYHKPLRDSHGTLVVSCVAAVRSAKAASVLNSRWLPLERLRRRYKALNDDNNIGDLLMASIHDQIHYHQASRVTLGRGLYLGYLKLQSSVDVVRIVVPARAPNVPPHTRVRENPHVSAEEWEYLKRYATSNSGSEDSLCRAQSGDKKPTESQQMFLDQITTAAEKLFRDMEISIDRASAHRLFDLEVLELNDKVSLIMICPPAEFACSVPGQKEILLQRGDLLSLPIQAFEMIHLQTYHCDILNKYSRLSCTLELDLALAMHSHREAFSSAELQQAKERLAKLEELQAKLNAVWKAARWLMDLICFARDKDKTSNSVGIQLRRLLHRAGTHLECDSGSEHLQIPSRDKMAKSSGRGSWPGPSGSPGNNTNLLHPELSKSEQHLSITPRQTSVSTLNLSGSIYLSANSDGLSTKNSTDLQFKNSNNYLGCGPEMKSSSLNSSSTRLLPSRSEDTLVIVNPEPEETRKRPHFLNASMSATSSPLLTVRGFYPGSMVSVRSTASNNIDSLQSLSSDSESQSFPKASTNKSRSKTKQQPRPPSLVVPSKSMTDVKRDVDFTDTGQHEVFLKPTAVRKVAHESDGDKSCKTDAVKRSKSAQNKTKESSGKSHEPAIIQVYAAYDTGLASGTSVKIHVTKQTTAREIIDLVVQNLNMAVVAKGKNGPVYEKERLQEFCLVVVVGARERCIRDDYRLLDLMDPWKYGRLYVRLKHDKVAAVQHLAKQQDFL